MKKKKRKNLIWKNLVTVSMLISTENVGTVQQQSGAELHHRLSAFYHVITGELTDKAVAEDLVSK